MADVDDHKPDERMFARRPAHQRVRQDQRIGCDHQHRRVGGADQRDGLGEPVTDEDDDDGGEWMAAPNQQCEDRRNAEEQRDWTPTDVAAQ
jgi:hypothetical protein